VRKKSSRVGTTIDPATFWKGTVAQRGGRALHDRDRGNDHLVRQLGEHIYMAFPGASLRSVGGAPVYAASDGLKGKEGEDYHLAFDHAGRYKLGRYPPGWLAKDRAEQAVRTKAMWAERRKR